MFFFPYFFWRHRSKTNPGINTEHNNANPWLLAFFILFATVYLGTFLAKTSDYLGKAPIVTDDDAIANVAVQTWNFQKYGYPASPTLIRLGTQSQPILQQKHFDGTRDYYNYGWLYFATAGFFNWTIGDDSIEFFRNFNAWAIVAIGILALLLFSSQSLLPGVVVMVLASGRMLSSVAPIMSRPDIAVTLAAILFICLSAQAIRKQSSLYWFLAGFWAATASTSHLVAWTISLSAFFSWLCSCYLLNLPLKFWRKSFGGLLAGGLSGIFLYLYLMDFRIFDLWNFVNFLNSYLQHPPYLTQLLNGYKSAWGGSQYTFAFAHAGLIGCLFFLAFIRTFRKEDRNQILSACLAPTLTYIFYLLSLGAYKSLLHPAYGILLYVLGAWLAGAATFSASLIIRTSFPIERKSALSNCLNFATLGILLISFSAMGKYTPPLKKQSIGWTRFSAYEEKVLESIPKGDTVWGAVNLGVKSGSRVQLLDSSVGFALLLHHNPIAWPDLSPSYFIFDYFTLQTYFFSGPARGKDNPLWFLDEITKIDEQYHLERVVFAPPYGNTFIFRKGKQQSFIPDGIYSNGLEENWRRNDSDWRKIPFQKSARKLEIDSRKMNGLVTSAKETVSSKLAPGVYLIEVEINDPAPVKQTGAIVVSSGLYFFLDGETRLGQSPLLRYQKKSFLIYEHKGDDFFVSYFPGRARDHEDKRHSYVKSIKTSFIGPKLSRYRQKVAMPPLENWSFPEKSDRKFVNGILQLKLNEPNQSEKYLLAESPWIPLEIGLEYAVEPNVRTFDAPVFFELKDDREESLLYGEFRNSESTIGFTSPKSNRIKIRLWTYNLSSSPIRFELGGPDLHFNSGNIESIENLLGCASGIKVDEKCANVSEDVLKNLDKEMESTY